MGAPFTIPQPDAERKLLGDALTIDQQVENARVDFRIAAMRIERDARLSQLTDEEERSLIRAVLGTTVLFPLAHAAALRGAADDFLNAMAGDSPAEPPTRFYVQFSDDCSAIRRWSLEPFDGGMLVEKSA